MSRRITVRLDDRCYSNLRQRCNDVGVDLSFAIREALRKYVDAVSSEKEAGTVTTNQAMPAEAFALEGPYRAWCGDLRIELRRRSVDLLALSHVAAENWKKSPGIREFFVAFLSACTHLGIGQGGRHD